MADEIRITIEGDASGATASLAEINAALNQAQAEMVSAGTAGTASGKAISEGMQMADYSMMEARHSAMLLGEEMGVHIPRAVSTMLASIGPLGALMAAAFPILGALALIDIIGRVIDKFSESGAAAEKADKQWKDMGHDMVESQNKANESLAKTIEEVDKIRTPGAVGQLRALEDEMDRLSNSSSSLGKAMQTVIDKEAEMAGKETMGDKIGNTLQKIFTYIPGLTGLANAYHNTHMEELALAEDAKEFGDKLRGTLDTEGTTAGLKLVTDELNKVYVALQKDPNNEPLLRYKTTLEGVQKALSTEASEKFWKEQKVGAEEAVIRTKELADVHKVLQDAIKETGKIEEEQQKVSGKLIDEELKSQLESELKAGEAILKAGDAELKLNEATAKSAAEAQMDVVAREKAAGHVQATVEAEQLLIQLLQQEKEAALGVVDAKLAEAQAAMDVAETSGAGGGLNTADYNNALAEYRNYQAQRLQIAAEADRRITAVSDAELKTETKEYQAYLHQFNSEFANAYANIEMGHETLGKSAARMYDQMTTSLLKNLAVAALAQMEGLALHKTVAAQKQLTDAKGAAGGAYNALADVPIIGPFIAPIAAATAFAAVMAFDEGGMVPATQMALVHSGEAVLTPQQTENLKAAADEGGGDTHYHDHTTTITTMDSADFKSFLKRNPGALSAGIEHAHKNGHLDLSRMARGK
jgi:hypothetical protein